MSAFCTVNLEKISCLSIQRMDLMSEDKQSAQGYLKRLEAEIHSGEEKLFTWTPYNCKLDTRTGLVRSAVGHTCSWYQKVSSSLDIFFVGQIRRRSYSYPFKCIRNSNWLIPLRKLRLDFCLLCKGTQWASNSLVNSNSKLDKLVNHYTTSRRAFRQREACV